MDPNQLHPSSTSSRQKARERERERFERTQKLQVRDQTNICRYSCSCEVTSRSETVELLVNVLQLLSCHVRHSSSATDHLEEQHHSKLHYHVTDRMRGNHLACQKGLDNDNHRNSADNVFVWKYEKRKVAFRVHSLPPFLLKLLSSDQA